MVLYTPRVKSPQAQPRDDKVCVECNSVDILEKWHGRDRCSGGNNSKCSQAGNQISHAARQEIFFRFSSPVELVTRDNIWMASPGICQIREQEIWVDKRLRMLGINPDRLHISDVWSRSVTLYSHVLGLGLAVVLAALPVPRVHGVGVSLGGVLRPGVVSRAGTRTRPSVRAQHFERVEFNSGAYKSPTWPI